MLQVMIMLLLNLKLEFLFVKVLFVLTKKWSTLNTLTILIIITYFVSTHTIWQLSIFYSPPPADENIRNALLFNVLKYGWSHCLDRTINTVMMVDEAHMLLSKYLIKAFKNCNVLVNTVYPKPSFNSSSSASIITSRGFLLWWSYNYSSTI